MIALAGTPVTTTERLVLRAPAARDWAHFNAFLASPRADSIRANAYDETLAWRAFGHVIGHWVLRGFGMFIFADRSAPDTPLGMAGPWFPEGSPEHEIGWSVWAAGAEGKGYAHEAAAAARDHAFRDLGWHTAVSYIAPDNARSIALAERLGAVRDAAAAFPGDKPCLVYRHPGPGDRR